MSSIMDMNEMNDLQLNIFSMTYNKHILLACSANELILLQNDKVIDRYKFDDIPLYSVASGNKLLTSTNINKIYITDPETKITTEIETKSSGIEKINVYKDNAYIFGGWNKKVSIYKDIETSFDTKYKIYQSDIFGDTFIFASKKHIVAYNLRNYSHPFYISENKSIVNCIKMLNTTNDFCIGCSDGKVKVENFSKNEREYLYFNAHKNKQGVYYGVNWIENTEDGLMTGGEDGNIYLWNLKEKKRLKQIASCEYSVHRFCTADGMYVCDKREADNVSGYYNHLYCYEE